MKHVSWNEQFEDTEILNRNFYAEIEMSLLLTLYYPFE